MRTQQLLACGLVVAALFAAVPSPAAAGPEVTFVLGAMIGDSLGDVLQVRPGTLTAGFNNAPIFGGRIGWSAFPFAVEGSLTYSPSSINVTNVGNFDANVVYAEAEIQIIILPGPVAPFIGGGLGIHSMQLSLGDSPRETTLGYVFGGGLKFAFGSIGARVDLKDHITPLDVVAANPDFVDLLGIAVNTNVHNVELSGGLTIRF